MLLKRSRYWRNHLFGWVPATGAKQVCQPFTLDIGYFQLTPSQSIVKVQDLATKKKKDFTFAWSVHNMTSITNRTKLKVNTTQREQCNIIL